MLKSTVSSLLTSLYAVYKAESNANDSLGLYNGTAQGGLTYSAGKSGNAFVGNGTNAYVSLPNNALNSLGSTFSISCWVSVVNTDGLQSIISSIARNAGNYYGVSLYNYGYMWFQIGIGTPSVVNLIEPSPITYNTWTHIVITKSSSGAKIYRNGTLTASNSSSTPPSFHTTNYCSIGAQQNTSYQYYAGNGTKIDEVNIWTKELTSTEITSLYNTGTGKFYPTF
jgi:hypothetical protein